MVVNREVMKQLQTQPLGMRVLRGAAAGFSIGILTNIILFGGQILIPRRLSRLEYADFTVSLSFVVLLSLIADFGMLHMHTRMLARAEEEVKVGQPDNRGIILGNILVSRLGLGIFVYALIILLGLVFYPTRIVSCMAILGITLFISSRLLIVRAAGESVLRSLGKFHIAAGFACLDAVLFALLLAIPRKLSLNYILWTYTLCHTPGFILLSLYVFRWIRRERIRIVIRPRMVMIMLKTATPLALSTAFFIAYNELDKLLLYSLGTLENVSSYGAIIRLTVGLAPIPYILSGIVAPELTRLLFREDIIRAQRLVEISLRGLLIVAGGAALLFTSAAHVVVPLILGAKYASDSSSFMLLNWLLLPLFISSFTAEMAIASGRFWLCMRYMAILLVCMLIGDLISIERFGVSGAVVSKVIAATVSTAYLIFSLRASSFLNVKGVLITIAKVICAIVVAIIPFFFLRGRGLNDLLVATAVVVLYISTIKVLGLFNVTELLAILKRLKKNNAGQRFDKLEVIEA